LCYKENREEETIDLRTKFPFNLEQMIRNGPFIEYDNNNKKIDYQLFPLRYIDFR